MEVRISIDGHVVKECLAVEWTEEEKVLDKYSVEYSGKHDHGELPKPRSGTPFDTLLKTIAGARKETSEFLGPLVEAEREASVSNKGKPPLEERASKKPKADSDS